MVKRIAMVLDLEWPVNRHYQVYAGVREYAETKADWELLPDNLPEVVLAGAWLGQHYDGLVGRIRPDALAAARNAGVPVVNTWVNSPVVNEVSSVLPDLAASARMAAAHFADRGLRHLAQVGMKSDRGRIIQAESLQEFAVEHGMSFSMHACGDSRHSGLDQWQEYCRQLHEWAEEWQADDRLPIGVLGSEDLIGRELAAVLPRSEWLVPDQIAIVTVGNSLVLCTSSAPAVSSIDLDYHRIGYLAAELLDHLMAGAAAAEEPILVPPKELHARRSSDVYAVSDPEVAEALQFMADNCDRNLSVDDVAKHAKMARRTLERRFRAATGESVTGKLNAMRVTRIKRLLLDTDDPVKSVHRHAGFGSDKQMRAIFRKLTGMTPAEFRRQKQ